MQFTCDYIELELERQSLLSRIVKGPFVLGKDRDEAVSINDREDKLFQQTLVPFFGQGKREFLEHTDCHFLYHQSDFRLQISFHYFKGQFLQNLKTSEKSNSSKVDSNMMMAAHERNLVRNDGLVGIAQNSALVGVLGDFSPNLANKLMIFSAENETKPRFLNRDKKGFYDLARRAYQSMGIETDDVVNRRLQAKAEVFFMLQEKAKNLSSQTWNVLDRARKPPTRKINP